MLGADVQVSRHSEAQDRAVDMAATRRLAAGRVRKACGGSHNLADGAKLTVEGEKTERWEEWAGIAPSFELTIKL